jgi:hypothetical protein
MAEAQQDERAGVGVSIAIIGNCQSGALVRCARAMLPDAEVSAVTLERIATEAEADAAAERALQADIVLSQEVRLPRFGRLRSEALKQLRPDVRLYPKVIFTGFHPDAVYVFEANKAVPSPAGTYHSQLLIGAFLAGLPLERALRLFKGEVYERLGYFEEFRKAQIYLVKTAAALDFDLHPKRQRWLQADPFMYTTNHPKPRVMASIGRLAFEQLGLSPAAADPEAIEDSLGRGVRLPVYPEIAERLGVEEPFLFTNAVRDGRASLTLEEFAAASYEAYRSRAPEVLASALKPGAAEAIVGM